MAIIVAGEMYYDLDGQLLEIKRQLRQQGGYPFDPEALRIHLQAAVEGRFIVAERKGAAAVLQVIDTIIRVDRSIRPIYPDWVQTVMHPEFENTGPAEFDLSEVEQWLYPKQKKSVVNGNVIYQYLKDNNMLKTCLGLRDGEEIRKKGIDLFRKFFQGKVVYLWKSVVRRRVGLLRVPFLHGGVSLVVLDWCWLGSDWDSDEPALRLANQP